MKLHYFVDPKGNFGDDLNPWLWPKVAPELLDENADEVFVGIGTLINHRMPPARSIHVFSSGFGYGRAPAAGASITYHAVRGPKSCAALGLPASTAVADGALLLRAIDFQSTHVTRSRVGFAPHCSTLDAYDWDTICRESGLHLLSVRWPVERFLAEVASCRSVICEAMHAAICADTLGIPWAAVVCSDNVLGFKWEDWLATVDLPYSPVALPSLYRPPTIEPAVSRLKQSVKRGLARFGVRSANWTDPPPRATGQREHDLAVSMLSSSRQWSFVLSDEVTRDILAGELRDRLARLLQSRQDPGRAFGSQHRRHAPPEQRAR